MSRKSISRRRFVKGAVGLAFTPGLAGRLPAAAVASDKRIRLIVDADTANEIDDLFAIARALMEPRFQIEGITSAQWHTQEGAPDDTVGASQKLNEEILRLMGKADIPHPQGANAPLVSQHRPQPSDAARHIIRQALETPPDEKLVVAILGPCTNLASAVLMEPAIISRVSCHFIGMRYDPEQKLWSKREFNTQNDPHALDLLLNTPGLEFHLMTATTSRSLVFQKTVVDSHLKGKPGLADFLVRHWDEYDRPWVRKAALKKETWVMWDIALIEAIARPALATAVQADTPDDNRQRRIAVWTNIDATAMQQDYWAAFNRYMDGSSRAAPF